MRFRAQQLLSTSAVLAMTLSSCKQDEPMSEPDATVAMVDSGSTLCERNTECDDGVFCNGAEQCAPSDGTADSEGCVSGSPPCAEGEVCNEAAEECGGCIVDDLDGDGVASVECGGNDCDDEDPARFVGNTEICDPLGVDDDCDLSTLGPDRDGDGYVGIECCNETTSMLVCGQDCDDNRATVSPEGIETCNGLDEDCDGMVDEGVQTTFYRDVDGDRFGTTETTLACSAPIGYSLLSGDCDDTNPLIFPGATERCDGTQDDDCDGAVDNGCSCTSAQSQECGHTNAMGELVSEGTCMVGTQACVNGVWDSCVGAVLPRAELCDGTDDNCDGVIDNGTNFMCVLGTWVDCTTRCGTAGTQQCRGDCRGYEECGATGEGDDASTCNGCDDDLDGRTDEGFECEQGTTSSCQTACDTQGVQLCSDDCTNGECRASAESCNYCDDDGDGSYVSDEFALAVGTHSDEPDCDDFTLTGPGAVCERLGPIAPIETRIRLAIDGTASSVWSAFREFPTPQGYGPTSVEVDIDVSATGTPGEGWAVIIREAGGEPPDEDDEDGLPNDRRGVAAVWRFLGDGPDLLWLYTLGGRASGPQTAGFCTGPGMCFPPAPPRHRIDSGGSERLQLTLTFTPDDPTVSGNQSSLSVTGPSAPSAGTHSSASQMNGSALPRPGQPLEWGIVAITNDNTFTLDALLKTEWLFPSPTSTHSTSASTSGLCL